MFFKNILNKEYQVVMSAAFMIGFFSFLSKILGLIRNRIFAGEFGAGDTLDIYFAAFRIPDFIYNLLIIGVLGSVFIPVFAEYLARGKKEAWRFANNVLTVFAAGVAIFSIVAIIFAPQIISLIAFGFDAQKQQATVALTRIMFLSPLLLGISSIIGSILQTNKMFFSFAVAPVFYN
ncbi:MAG: lipid II flippase MurJ, partial [Patescibacteria group bacterium]